MRRLLPLLLLLAGLIAAPAARAQTIRWDPPGGTLPVGEVSDLRLIFEGCSADSPPKFPKIDGLTLEYRGQSSSMSLINGTFSSTVEMSVSVLLAKPQAVDIPAFVITTNKGPIHVGPVHFNPASATVGTSGVSLSDAASAKLVPAATDVWAGEVFDLDYSIDVAASYSPNWGRGAFEWDPAPLIAEDWSLPAPFDDRANGRTGLRYKTRAFVPSAGRLTLHPTNQLIALAVGVSGFGFFQQRQYQEFSVADAPVVLNVRPLPPAPAGFQGAVGDFKVASKIVPSTVKVGEPITWTIELSGAGNWPQLRGLPAREAPADFQVISPKPKRTQPAGKLFDGTLSEDVVLVPTQAGEYDLPPVDFVYFDPKSGAYKTVTAPGAHVTAEAVAPAAAPGTGAAAAGAPAISTEPPPAAAAPEAKAPELPTGALGDPLAAHAPAPGLVRGRTAALAVGTAFLLVVVLWIGLASQRARATDPLRERRAARRRLLATLEALRSAPGSERAALLLRWQRDSAVLWGVPHAAPPAAQFPAADWAQLWTDADRSLYAANTALPPDWSARAQAALEAKRLPALTPFSFLRPRNLLPLLLLAAALGLRAAPVDPAAAYRSGDFATAEKAWSAAVAAQPRDWSARHNLSLALAQQDRWAEAAVQATAAFLQHPTAATRRQLALAGDKAGFLPEPVDTLLQGGAGAGLALWQSPGAWQRTTIGAGVAVALALALLLLGAYRKLPARPAVAAALVLLLLGLATGLSAWLALRAYGLAEDPRAVVAWRAGTLRSIPSEADLKQKTTTLAAGSTALVDRTFLRWQHLKFANGQTGWVPESETIFLWQAPPK